MLSDACWVFVKKVRQIKDNSASDNTNIGIAITEFQQELEHYRACMMYPEWLLDGLELMTNDVGDKTPELLCLSADAIRKFLDGKGDSEFVYSKLPEEARKFFSKQN